MIETSFFSYFLPPGGSLRSYQTSFCCLLGLFCLDPRVSPYFRLWSLLIKFGPFWRCLHSLSTQSLRTLILKACMKCWYLICSALIPTALFCAFLSVTCPEHTQPRSLQGHMRNPKQISGAVPPPRYLESFLLWDKLPTNINI